MTSHDHKTKNFLERIDLLIEKGVVKDYAEVVKTLDWNKSVMSSVKNGKLQVPQHIFIKFNETYKDELARLQQDEEPTGYKEKYLQLLEKMVERDEKLEVFKANIERNSQNIALIIDRLTRIEKSLAFVAAYQKAYQDYYAEYYPPPGVETDVMKREMFDRAISQMESFEQEGLL